MDRNGYILPVAYNFRFLGSSSLSWLLFFHLSDLRSNVFVLHSGGSHPSRKNRHSFKSNLFMCMTSFLKKHFNFKKKKFWIGFGEGLDFKIVFNVFWLRGLSFERFSFFVWRPTFFQFLQDLLSKYKLQK